MYASKNRACPVRTPGKQGVCAHALVLSQALACGRSLGAEQRCQAAVRPQCAASLGCATGASAIVAICGARAQALALVSDVHALAAQVRSRCKKGGGGSGGSGGRGGDGGGGGNGSVTPRGGHLGLPSACTLVQRLSAAPSACLAGARAGRWAGR